VSLLVVFHSLCWNAPDQRRIKHENSITVWLHTIGAFVADIQAARSCRSLYVSPLSVQCSEQVLATAACNVAPIFVSEKLQQ
jgi:hypothetical protein